MLVAALWTTTVLALLFATVTVVFVLLGLGALAAQPVLTTIGGILGLVAAALAWYPRVPTRRSPKAGRLGG